MASNALWRRVAEDIAGKIRDGEYAIGSRIPSYHALAATHRVSIGTARHAVDVLRAHGVIEGESGVGLYVKGMPPESIDPVDPIASMQDQIARLEARVERLERERHAR